MPAPFNTSPGLLHQPTLEMGFLELEYLQADHHRRNRLARLLNMSEPGFLARWAGNSPLPDFGWTVEDPAGDGVLKIKTYADASTAMDPAGAWTDPDSGESHPRKAGFVDHEGRVVEIPQIDGFDIGVSVPNDGTARVLVVAASTVQTLPGTIAVDGSTTVIGTNTRFTEHLIGVSDSDNPTGRGSKIRIAGSSNGNDGLLVVDEVVSDTEITLVTAPVGTSESGLSYRLAGNFYTTPATAAGYDIANRLTAAFSLEDDVVGSKTTDGLVAFRIVRTGGTTTISDRRVGQLWQPFRNEPRGYFPIGVPRAGFLPSGDQAFGNVSGADEYVQHNWIAEPDDTSNAARCSAAMISPGLSALVAYSTTAGNIEAAVVPMLSSGLGTVGPSQVTVDSSTGAAGCALMAFPEGDPGSRTHAVFYILSGTVVMRTTTDNGATWTGTTTIWNPPAVDSGDTVAEPAVLLTLDGRIIVAGVYTDDSGNYDSLRWIFSDDLGATWDTNSHAGYTLVEDDTDTSGWRPHDPSMAQDGLGNIFTAYARYPFGNNDTEIRVFRGIGPNDPTPARNKAGTQYDEEASLLSGDYAGEVVSPANDFDSTGYDFLWKTPAIWAAPDGGLLVFYSGATTGQSPNQVVTACSSVMWSRSLARPAAFTVLRRMADAAAAPSWGGCLVQDSAGLIDLFYGGRYTGATVEPVEWQPVLPVQLPRTRSLSNTLRP